VFFILGVTYFYLIFFTGFQSIEEILKELPTQVNWASRRKQLVKGINQWMTEALFYEQKTFGYKVIMYAE
jgi:hypothetical protein